MITKSLVTRKCKTCGKVIQPGELYNTRTGECVVCIQVKKK